MARFDVYRNPAGPGYLLDVQTDLLDGLNTRMVVPLLPRDCAPKPARRLNPLFDINGEAVMMATQFMAAVPVAALSASVLSLDAAHDEIVAAIDLLLSGF